MSAPDLRTMLEDLPDTREVVIRRVADGDGILAVWRAAAQDARSAYAAWCDRPGAASHAAYLAAADQADAALASLSLQHAERRELLPA